ncbi:MAG TPA: hypothetical protein VN133_07610 [Humibacter sp.]|nr:hypothetical protein [Humibacter sp.]
MAIMLGMSNPLGRIIIRIVVLHTSAQFVHMLMHFTMPSAMPASAHIVQACSQAAHASIHSCIAAMSICGMPAISADMLFIISAVMLSMVLPSSRAPTDGRRLPNSGSAV